jgi:hypothetical protein
MPTEKTQPSCPGSRDLNWTGKGLKSSKKKREVPIPHGSLKAQQVYVEVKFEGNHTELCSLRSYSSGQNR